MSEFFLCLDDLTLIDGTMSPNAAVFGNQWRLDKSVNIFLMIEMIPYFLLILVSASTIIR
jgi:hypothetical protein